MTVQWTSGTAWLLRVLHVVGAAMLVAALAVPSARAVPGPVASVGSAPDSNSVAAPGVEAARSGQPIRLADVGDAVEALVSAALTRARPELGAGTRESPEQPTPASAVLAASATGAAPARRAGADDDLVLRVEPPQLRLLSTRAGP